jgi:uncharacterized membrane protein YgcG
MKLLLAFVLFAILVMVVVRSMRNERSTAMRRRFPGPDLPPRYDGTDTSLIGSDAFGGESSHHGHGHGHGADCAPSHDAGGSVDCGGGDSGGDGGGSH